jgi:hypothetical protein
LTHRRDDDAIAEFELAETHGLEQLTHIIGNLFREWRLG